MPIFKVLANPIGLNEINRINLPVNSTPNDFKKIIIGDNEFPMPTVCFLDVRGEKRVFLKRYEWNRPIQDNESCGFLFHPQAEGGVAIAVSLAISIIIGVATYLLTPKPNLNLNQQNTDTSPTYDLNQQGNKPRLGQPIPIHYGTMRCYPDVANLPFSTSVYPDKNLYIVGLCVGQGYISIEDEKIDDTPLSTFPWVTRVVTISDGTPVVMGGFTIPMFSSKEVKEYLLNSVDAIVQAKTAVIRAVDSNVNIASPGASLDSYTPSSTDRFLFYGQTDQTQNGIWIYDTATTAMERSTDMDDEAEFLNATVAVTGGTYTGKSFIQVNDITSVGANSVSFEPYDATNGVGDWFVVNDANDILATSSIFYDFVFPQGLYALNGSAVDKGNVYACSLVNIDITNCPSYIDGMYAGGAYASPYVLLAGQDDPTENGVYDSPIGSAMTRRTTLDDPSEFANAKVYAQNSSNRGHYIQTATVAALGTDSIIFAKYDPSSSFLPKSVEINIYLQEIDDDGVNVGSEIIYHVTISGKTNQPVYYTEFINMVYPILPTRYKTKVLLKNAPLYKTNTDYMDKCNWSGLRYLLQEQTYYLNKTFLVIEAQASGKLNNSNVGIWNCLGKRHLWVYDFGATTWSKIQSNSPIWAFWDLATSGRGDYDYGLSLDESTQLDLGNMEDIYDLIQYEGYECNARFDTALSAREALSQIAQSMKCIYYQRGGKFLLAYDGFKTSMQGFFTRANANNVSVDFFTKNSFSATWFKVTYFDEDTNKKETVDCIIAGESTETGDPEEVEFHTITNRLQAWKYGQYLCAQNRYHTTKVRFQTDMEGFLPNPLDHISFCHPSLNSDTQHGYIQKVASSIIYLSEPVDFQGYANGLISFKNKNGTGAGPYVCVASDTNYKVELIPFSVNAEDYTGFTFYSQEDQNDFEATEFTFGVENSSEVLVIKSITPNGSNSANVEAVVRNGLVYTAGIDEHNMPDYGDDTSVAQWYPYFLQAISFTSNIFTKENILDWNGNGYSFFTLRYLYDDGGSEELDDYVITGANTAVTPTAFNHTYTHTYSAPPSRVTITPRIWVIDSTYRDLTELAIVVPIQLVE